MDTATPLRLDDTTTHHWSQAEPPAGHVWVSYVASLAVGLIGALVLLGWLLDIEFLKSVVPGLRVMVPNSAICFVLSGLALGLTQRDGPQRSWRILAARTAACLVVILGLASLAEYLINVRLGVEHWILHVSSDEGVYAGRMSPQTAVNFALVGSALVLLRLERRWAGAAADSFSLAVLAVAWLALTGFAFDVTRLYDAPRYPGLALHTAVAFFVLCVGLLFSHGHALAGRLTSTAASGAMLRRFLPLALVVPVILGWMRLTGERAGWYDQPFGLALLTIGFTLLLIAVVGANAMSLHQMEDRRHHAERALHAAHDELEQRVEQRTGELAAMNEALYREIGQRKDAQDELAALLAREHAARRRAEEADRVKEEFLATVSHELRAPLNSILGWVHLIKEGALAESGHERALATIERSARVQKQLVEDLLDASRTTTGKLHLNLHAVEIVPIVQAAVDAARPTAEAKNVTITTRFDSDAGCVLGDADRLQQVAWNLVANAIKFTPAGGNVCASARRLGPSVEVAVTDTGVGIEPDTLPYVFDRFRQGNGSTTRSHGGLGLGLSIVRHLVELHGGQVRAESQGADRGAAFTVTLPITASVPQRASDHDDRVASVNGPGEEASAPSVRVLVVDDDPDSRELVKTILERSGASVDVVASSAAAATRLTEQSLTEPFDVLVCDVGMPEEDGYALIRRVRTSQDDRVRQTPAVALTGYTAPEDRVRAAAAGFQVHVPKPLEPATLLAAIQSLARRPLR